MRLPFLTPVGLWISGLLSWGRVTRKVFPMFCHSTTKCTGLFIHWVKRTRSWTRKMLFNIIDTPPLHSCYDTIMYEQSNITFVLYRKTSWNLSLATFGIC